MKLWLIKRDVNGGYDTYDSAVVAAETEQAARETHPAMVGRGLTEPGMIDRIWWNGAGGRWLQQYPSWPVPREYEISFPSWVNPSDVTVTCVGDALAGVQAGVICASFNAG